MFKFLNIFRRKKKVISPGAQLLKWDKEDVATLQALAYQKVEDYRNPKEKTEEEMRYIRWRMIENNWL